VLLLWATALAGVAGMVYGNGPAALILCCVLSVTVYVLSAIDAYDIARKAQPLTLKWYQRWYFYIVFFIVLCLAEEAVRETIKQNFCEAFRIPSTAMSPTLIPGDNVLVTKRAYIVQQPERNDVIVHTLADDPLTPQDESAVNYVKRIVAVGGDLVEIRGTTLYLNGKIVEEPFAQWALGGEKEQPPLTVPEGCYFVLGDNRDYSKDSRYWSDPFVHREQITGKVLSIYWPWDRAGATVR